MTYPFNDKSDPLCYDPCIDPCRDPPNRRHGWFVKEVTPNKRFDLITMGRPDDFAGQEALASVLIYQSDVTINPFVGMTNSRLIVEVGYASGDGNGGQILVDATRGAFVAVPASTGLTVSTYLESSREGVPINVYATKRVTGAVQWRTSINPVKSLFALPMFDVIPAVVNVHPIPQTARSMMVVSNASTDAALAGLRADFLTDPTITSLKYRRIRPDINSAPIVLGVEFVSITATVGQTVSPVFELLL